MAKEYCVARTKFDKCYSDFEVKNVYIPAGTKVFIVDNDDGFCIVEFVEDNKGYPLTADFMEDELEMVEDD